MAVESILQDIRYALRGIRRTPLFAGSVAGTIGIGLGILCSVFTIVNAFLLKSVNLPESGELYALAWDAGEVQGKGFSLADFDALSENNPVFAHTAAARPVSANVDGVSIVGHLVTAGYFRVLGATAALGRTIAEGDFTSDHSAVVVLSHEGWRAHFHADPAIVGRDIALGGGHFVVAGVMPEGAVLAGDEPIAFWVPMAAARAFEVPDPARDSSQSLLVVGRRRAETTVEQVTAWFDTWVRQRFPVGSPVAATGSRVLSLATRIPITRVTVLLFSLLTAAFGLVLLAASANVTNMLLARGLGRQRELGVRLSLGASRARIIRQLIVESVVLSLPAAAIGLGLTYATAREFPRILTETIPAGAQSASLFMAPLDPDLRVVALLITAGFFAALFAGLSPALQLTRASLVDAMRGELGPNTSISRVRSAFVAVQIATCVLFLVAAIALVVESRRMASAHTGLDDQQVLELQTSDQLRPVIAAELRRRGEVEAVAAVWRAPLVTTMLQIRVTALPGTVQQNAGMMGVTPEYFATMGARITRGRALSEADAREDAPVVLVSEATARLFWPGQDPIGQSIAIAESGPPQNSSIVTRSVVKVTHKQVTVVGVVEDVINGTLLDGVARTSLYFPTALTSPQVTRLLVRTRGDSAVAARAIATAIEAAHPTAAFQLTPLQQRTAIQVWVFNAFSAAALIPAVVGMLLSFAGTYGVVAFVMTQRTREFGIRMALGATARQIMQSVVGGTLRTAVVASLIGLVATVGLIRAGAAVLGVVPVIRPGIYATGVAVVVLASVVASLLPALRAIRINPSNALRAD